MDIRQMEYFNTICENGNMSAAAQKLFVSQQALSKSIEHLEQPKVVDMKPKTI